MKNYEEVTNDLLERRDHFVVLRRQNRKRVIVFAVSFCCFCLIFGCGFLLRSGGVVAPPLLSVHPAVTTGNDRAEPGYLTDPPYQIETSVHVDPIENNDICRFMWCINRVDEVISAARLNFSEDKYYSKIKDCEQVTQYFGEDLSDMVGFMPEGFVFTGNGNHEFVYELNGKLVYDSCAFSYMKEDQQILILVSKIGVPYDCIYQLHDPTISQINGVDVTLGGIYQNDEEDFRLIFADFSKDGLQYRVTIENVPFDGQKDAPTWLFEIVGELTK
jgi:hypothetical protein